MRDDYVFFFNDTATTEIYTLSLHDALPIFTASIILQLLTVVVPSLEKLQKEGEVGQQRITQYTRYLTVDRKSTRLNSSHANISYAVFCLKKKNHNIFSFL